MTSSPILSLWTLRADAPVFVPLSLEQVDLAGHWEPAPADELHSNIVYAQKLIHEQNRTIALLGGVLQACFGFAIASDGTPINADPGQAKDEELHMFGELAKQIATLDAAVGELHQCAQLAEYTPLPDEQPKDISVSTGIHEFTTRWEALQTGFHRSLDDLAVEVREISRSDSLSDPLRDLRISLQLGKLEHITQEHTMRQQVKEITKQTQEACAILRSLSG